MREPPIPDRFWRRLLKVLALAEAGEFPGGGQIVLNISPTTGRVTSFEWKGRDDGR